MSSAAMSPVSPGATAASAAGSLSPWRAKAPPLPYLSVPASAVCPAPVTRHHTPTQQASRRSCRHGLRTWTPLRGTNGRHGCQFRRRRKASPGQHGTEIGGAGRISEDHLTQVVSSEIGAHGEGEDVDRSEEHTSELQSLMRISYAVFCLK